MTEGTGQTQTGMGRMRHTASLQKTTSDKATCE